MPAAAVQTQANRVRRVSITIPANAGTAVTLESLVIAALNVTTAGLGDAEKPWIIGGAVTILPAAIIVGDSASSLPQNVAILTAGVKYSEPSVDFLRRMWW